MMIDANDKDLSEPKTLKVSLPTKIYLQLHQLKLLTGQNISTTVTEAVQRHMGDMDAQAGAGGDLA